MPASPARAIELRPAARAEAAAEAAEAARARIETESLDAYFGQTRAVRDVSLALRDRRVTAIIGPSGCGKSTFLRSINRMNELIPRTRSEGDILLRGDSIFDPQLDVVRLR
ncbi:MAG TPA: ATP-binding cassette domain-containing protein, partial [Gemmatimonadaceae bacterium]|nr:ATP-binding cassette domain-containing protein [Gemmatimonadaceae bacterium]